MRTPPRPTPPPRLSDEFAESRVPDRGGGAEVKEVHGLPAHLDLANLAGHGRREAIDDVDVAENSTNGAAVAVATANLHAGPAALAGHHRAALDSHDVIERAKGMGMSAARMCPETPSTRRTVNVPG